MTLIYSAVGFRIRPAHCSARALKVCVGCARGYIKAIVYSSFLLGFLGFQQPYTRGGN